MDEMCWEIYVNSFFSRQKVCCVSAVLLQWSPLCMLFYETVFQNQNFKRYPYRIWWGFNFCTLWRLLTPFLSLNIFSETKRRAEEVFNDAWFYGIKHQRIKHLAPQHSLIQMKQTTIVTQIHKNVCCEFGTKNIQN
jgi:hypothetical protein